MPPFHFLGIVDEIKWLGATGFCEVVTSGTSLKENACSLALPHQNPLWADRSIVLSGLNFSLTVETLKLEVPLSAVHIESQNWK